MDQFKVTDILDGMTIQVYPKWQWVGSDGKSITGDTVTIQGYEIPAADKYELKYAKAKLEGLLLNKCVVLRNPVKTNDRILCKVIFHDVDISNYFPEHKTNNERIYA